MVPSEKFCAAFFKKRQKRLASGGKDGYNKKCRVSAFISFAINEEEKHET